MLNTGMIALLVLKLGGLISVISMSRVLSQPSLSGQGIPATYAQWLIQTSNQYDHVEFLGSSDELALHWKIEAGEIFMAVAIGTSGWLGVGISESGGMKGADMFIFNAKSNELIDAYSTDYKKPEDDVCQDWKLIQATVDDLENFMIVEVSRPLDTGDPQDIEIHDDSAPSIPRHRVIAAWGDDEQAAYHGKNVGMKFFQLYAPSDNLAIVTKTFDMDQGLEDEQFDVDVRASEGYIIPANHTTYEDFCFYEGDLLNLGLNLTENTQLIKAHYVEGGHDSFVHHIVLSGKIHRPISTYSVHISFDSLSAHILCH